jgi:hypothetical protein
MKTLKSLLIIPIILLVAGCAQLDKAILGEPKTVPYTNSAGVVLQVPTDQVNPQIPALVETGRAATSFFGPTAEIAGGAIGTLILAAVGAYARGRNAAAKAAAEKAERNRQALATVVAGVEQGSDSNTKKAIYTMASANGTQPLIESLVNPSA